MDNRKEVSYIHQFVSFFSIVIVLLYINRIEIFLLKISIIIIIIYLVAVTYKLFNLDDRERHLLIELKKRRNEFIYLKAVVDTSDKNKDIKNTIEKIEEERENRLYNSDNFYMQKLEDKLDEINNE